MDEDDSTQDCNVDNDEYNCNSDDNPIMQSTESGTSSGSQYQSENSYNKFLPYADDLEAESMVMLADIKANTAQAIFRQEIRPGCSIWATQLHKYVQLYGLKFSKEDHIIFVKLLYELCVIPNLEPHLLEVYGDVLILLLRKKRFISPDDLELPWRPLYDIVWRSKQFREVAIQSLRQYQCIKNTLWSIVHYVKTYFPVSATQEILDEIRPKLCPIDGKINVYIELAEMFLPVQLPPKYHSLGYQLWFEEFMTLWEVCHNAPPWEYKMMNLMSKLATCNIGYINWEPYLPLMFSRFVRYLNLPVSYKNIQSNKHHKMDIPLVATWIAAVLGHGSSAQMYLDKFLKSIETYFHPANFGRWSLKLRDILQKLPYSFALRLHRERYAKPSWETPIPNEYKLTDDDIDAFVKSMKPLVMTAMFNKFGVFETYQCLEYLVALRPNLIIPDVLERMYSSLDSLTEPHKLTASMSSMAAIAKVLVQGSGNVNTGYTYTEGPINVMALLFSFLPGIDPNDLRKSIVAFRAISSYVIFIPIVDCSRTTSVTDEEERMICETTSRFEDFVLQFLDRVFLFIDAVSLDVIRFDTDTKGGKDTVMESALFAIATTLLYQTSDNIFECALHKLRTFLTERNLETKVAGRLAAVLCRAFARTNGQKTVKALIPVLSQMILDIIEEGDDIMKEENPDSRLLYALVLLGSTAIAEGTYLLPYIDTLIQIVDRVLLIKSRDGSLLGCALLQAILCGLSTSVISKYKFKNRDYNDPDYPYVRDWGKPQDLKDVSVEWYVPGKEEIETAQRLFLKYLQSEVEKLQKYCDDPTTLTRDQLLVSLHTVYAVVAGCEQMLPMPEEDLLFLPNVHIDWLPFQPTLGNPGQIRMPDGENAKHYLTRVMSTIQKSLLKNAEDNTSALYALSEIWSSLLLGEIRQRDGFEGKQRMFDSTKKIVTDKITRMKTYARFYVSDRVGIQHGLRLYLRAMRLTETPKEIMFELFTLATSRYAAVRLRAQQILDLALRYYPFSSAILVPNIVDILKDDVEKNYKAFKGALYCLNRPTEQAIITIRNWKLLRSLWPALVLSKPSEKPNLNNLKDCLMEYVNKNFIKFTINLDIPEKCMTTAAALWENYPQPSLPQPNEDEIKKALEIHEEVQEFNRQMYRELVNELLDILLKGDLHWRHSIMATRFLLTLIHRDEIYPPKAVRFFLGALINDSIEIRKIAVTIMVYILRQHKRKHPKVTIDLPTPPKTDESQGDKTKRLIPGPRPDNRWLQYNYETRPLTAEQWDEPRFVHQTYTGYTAWPKKLEIYAPSSEQPCLDPSKRKLTEHEKEVDLFFNDTQNIDKLIKYHSLEEKNSKFNLIRFLLYKSIFRNHGDVFLPHFLPHLRKLVLDKQESSQRCAAEIITGIIRGAKHWPFEMVSKMWECMLPIIRSAIDNLTTETLSDWSTCFATAQYRRDPNRYHWLFECLMEESPLRESQSTFAECSRWYILRDVHQSSWRLTQITERLMTRLENRLLTNPFDNVRERLASTLVTLFDSDVQLSNDPNRQSKSRVQSLMEKVIPRIQILADKDSSIFSKEEQDLSNQLKGITMNPSKSTQEIDKANVDTEREMAIRVLKTVCQWIIDTINQSLYGILPEFYEVFPIIYQLENYDADRQLKQMCSKTIAILAHAFTLPRNMPIALEAVTRMSRSSSWWTRSTSLQFLQVMIFHNMGIILSRSEWITCVQSIVLKLLEDERLEVRESAGHVLGGLLHCTFIPQQDILLEELKKKAKTKLHKKNHAVSNDDEAARNSKADALRIRHAGVLGLCAFIQAHPYDIPKYVPSIFENLGVHMNDPQPIPTTIRKTLGDFKRTHYDGWSGINGHEQHFTEEQLGVLQDLTAPPSYYV